ncbi:NAD-dependent epimerase/dehydratase family protein [Micromonospora sp. WMMD980]|uniref:NAD-dependent epimerase/dehydratase family protein n=1 Tax=Micromonospora sp. WMMD980 TaxID=3016088 RepID=UPI002416C7FD|nr:NAD-dependent epimerase/dehydratase family protein [Micromonospora sp. WMMD980]MDG4803232.1 NAD-dependent epimerase/dehydratase family protein [Micromonospora sp. WMMD980]
MNLEHFRGKRILVTGAAGFIGGHLVHRLVALGAAVVGLDRVPAAEFPGERHLVGDVTTLDPSIVREIQPELVFHLASVVGVTEAAADADITTDAIVGGTREVLDAAARAGCRHFVFVSSSEVYGEAVAFPITESTPHAPLSAYGKAKSTAERLVQEQTKAHGMRATIIRPFNVYGPRQRLDFVIPRFVSLALRDKAITLVGDGQQLRTFTYITDFVAGTLAAVAEKSHGPAIYNISGADTWNLEAVAVGVVRALGSRSEIVIVDPADLHRPPDIEIKHRVASHSLAGRQLGYVPQVPLMEGIGKVAAAMRQPVELAGVS